MSYKSIVQNRWLALWVFIGILGYWITTLIASWESEERQARWQANTARVMRMEVDHLSFDPGWEQWFLKKLSAKERVEKLAEVKRISVWTRFTASASSMEKPSRPSAYIGTAMLDFRLGEPEAKNVVQLIDEVVRNTVGETVNGSVNTAYPRDLLISLPNNRAGLVRFGVEMNDQKPGRGKTDDHGITAGALMFGNIRLAISGADALRIYDAIEKGEAGIEQR